MMYNADHYLRKTFPRDVQHFGATIPLMEKERVLAYDSNGQLWAFQLTPRWSPASQKWIPEDEDTPRLIFTRNDGLVNAKDSIEIY